MVQEFLDRFDLDSDRSFFLIFDVDGTLRPDTVEALDHRYPRIDPTVAQQIMELNTHERVRVAILTARSYIDIYRSNLPNNITKYCGFGKQIVENGILRYAREDFHLAFDEITMFIDIIKDILGPKLTANLDFLSTPGDFALYFEKKDFEEQKTKIVEILEIVLMNSTRWKMMDYGKELIFKDLKYPYDKGDAIFDILDASDLHEITQVCFFGDSNDDLKAMIALREYQQLYPQKRLKVKNIAVGPALAGKEEVNFAFESYKDTLEFVNLLHAKLMDK